jgi:hypothetical protein
MRPRYDTPWLFAFFITLFPACGLAGEPPAELHATARYQLEEIYGRDHAAWPATYVREDVNGDGQSDWITGAADCGPGEDCESDVFLCRRWSADRCDDYCYAGSVSLSALRAEPGRLKCEGTC